MIEEHRKNMRIITLSIIGLFLFIQMCLLYAFEVKINPRHYQYRTAYVQLLRAIPLIQHEKRYRRDFGEALDAVAQGLRQIVHPHIHFEKVLVKGKSDKVGLTQKELVDLAIEAIRLISENDMGRAKCLLIFSGELLKVSKKVDFHLYPSTQVGGFIVCVWEVADRIAGKKVTFKGNGFTIGAEVIHLLPASYEKDSSPIRPSTTIIDIAM